MTLTRPFAILLVDPPGDAKATVAEAVAAERGMSLVGCATNLAEAARLSDMLEPDLVLFAAKVARDPAYVRFVEELRTRGIRRAILPATPSGISLSGFRSTTPDCPPEPGSPDGGAWKTVVIGASTGGIEALLDVLSHWTEQGPPTLIVQHINPGFLDGLADRLDRQCAPTVRPAKPGAPVVAGRVYLAPGSRQHLVLGPGGRECRMVDGPPVSGHRPSVDTLFHSAAALGAGVVGVILTGMGQDGARGLAAIRAAGGHTIGQDRESAVVYGMPRAAMSLDAVAEQLPIGQIGPAALRAAAQRQERAEDV